MKYTLSKLNSKGLEAFKSYIDTSKEKPELVPPFCILKDKRYSTRTEPEIIVENGQNFNTRLEFGKYLNDLLLPIKDSPDLPTDSGIWSWFTLCFFDLFCPADEGGKRLVHKDWYYILSKNYNHHYRHLVRTPWYIYKLHKKNSGLVLSVPLTVAGEAVEQLLSRQQVATNIPLFKAMYELYVVAGSDPVELKKGARGSGAGSMRRIGKILKQFDLTYDLRAMDGFEIYDLFPREFNKFKTMNAM